MIIYKVTKKDFCNQIFDGCIEDTIRNLVKKKLGRDTPRSEYQSWANSLPQIEIILRDPEIPDNAMVAIEYVIPRTQNRIDIMVSGKNAIGKNILLIIELKQWSKANCTTKDAMVSTRFSGGMRDTLHPSYQAWSYTTLLNNFNEYIQSGECEVISCVYLHNYQRDNQIDNDLYKPYISRSPIFCKGEKTNLRNFIKENITHGDSSDIIECVENSNVLPSKQLAEYLSSLLKGNREFLLIDNQKEIFEEAKQLANKATTNGEKEVLIVRGGPGTGKTVIAIKLLNALISKGKDARYVSRNSAPREVYKAKLTKTFKKSQLDLLFSGSGCYHSIETDAYDALIVDESHRLNFKSGMFGNLGENQISEIIKASKFSIFFLDEDQRVTLQDIGSEQEIRRCSNFLAVNITVMDLESQFRCDGSAGYLSWLDNTLGIRKTANMRLGVDSYDFRVFDDPSKLRSTIEDLNNNGKTSRIVAGYCWPWISKTGTSKWKKMSSDEKKNAYDIVFPDYDFRMRWNLVEHGQGWLAHPESINEIGCIHTCQGLETDYIGVIIGDDFKVIDGQIMINPDAHPGQDRALKGWKKLLKESPIDGKTKIESVIKNTYRTLMSRGIKGCFIYSQDSEIRQYFQKLLN